MHGRWIGMLLLGVGVVAAASPTSVDRAEGNLHLTASVTKTAYAVGEVVEVTLTVKNTGTGALALTFQSGQSFDIVVRQPRGAEVWRWSHDKAFQQVILSRALQAGESLTYRGSWDQRDLQGRRVEPGTYEVVAMFMGHSEGMDRRSLAMPPLTITIRE